MGSVSSSSPASPTFSRAAYLRHCVRVSLLKRWPWPLLTALLGAVAGWQLSWPLWALALLAFMGLLLSAGWIALSSWRRHAADLPPLP